MKYDEAPRRRIERDLRFDCYRRVPSLENQKRIPSRLKLHQRESNSCQLFDWWMRGRSHERCREVAAAFSIFGYCGVVSRVGWMGHAVVRSSQRPRPVARAAL